MSQQFFKYIQKNYTPITFSECMSKKYITGSEYSSQFIDLLIKDLQSNNLGPILKIKSLINTCNKYKYLQAVPMKFILEYAKQLDADPQLDKERQNKKQTIPLFFNQKYNSTLSNLGYIMSTIENLDIAKIAETTYKKFAEEYTGTDNEKLFAIAAKEYYDISKDNVLLYNDSMKITNEEYIEKIVSKIPIYYFISALGEIYAGLDCIRLNPDCFSQNKIDIIINIQYLLYDEIKPTDDIVKDEIDEETTDEEIESPKAQRLPAVIGCGLNLCFEIFSRMQLEKIFSKLCDKIISRNEKAIIRSLIRYHYNANYELVAFDSILPKKLAYIICNIGSIQIKEQMDIWNENRKNAHSYLYENYDKNCNIAAELMYAKLKADNMEKRNLYNAAEDFYKQQTMVSKCTPREAFEKTFYDGASVIVLYGLNIIANKLISKIKSKQSSKE